MDVTSLATMAMSMTTAQTTQNIGIAVMRQNQASADGVVQMLATPPAAASAPSANGVGAQLDIQA